MLFKVYTKSNETDQSAEVFSFISNSERQQTMKNAKCSKPLKQVTIKNHKYDFEKVKNETKPFLRNEEIKPTIYCYIKVDQFEEILKKTSR